MSQSNGFIPQIIWSLTLLILVLLQFGVTFIMVNFNIALAVWVAMFSTILIYYNTGNILLKNISFKYWNIQHCFNWLLINTKKVIDLPLKNHFGFLHIRYIKIFICSNQSLSSIILTLVESRGLEIFVKNYKPFNTVIQVKVMRQ